MKKVLLLDDDPIHNYVNQKFIEKTHPGTDVMEFLEAPQALQYLKENTPDLIFLDIDLPQVNGWQFLHQYQHFERKAKVVILTSSIDPTDKERALGFDCVDGFIVKPLNSHIARTELEKV
jgi:CheY-like chemotaxis protein